MQQRKQANEMTDSFGKSHTRKESYSFTTFLFESLFGRENCKIKIT